MKGVFRQMMGKLGQDDDSVEIRACYDDGEISGYAVQGGRASGGCEPETFRSIEEVALCLAVDGRDGNLLYLEIPDEDVARLCEIRKDVFNGAGAVA